MLPKRVWLLCTIAWTGLIFFSSTTLAGQWSEQAFQFLFGAGRQSSDSLLHFLAEKSVHLTLFFVLGILLSQLYTAAPLARFGKVVLTGLVIGSLSELLQNFFPGRDPALRDVLINVGSTALGAALAAWVGNPRPLGNRPGR